MAEIYLKAGGEEEKFSSLVKALNRKEINVFNYYWFPHSSIVTGEADAIILPEIYSGTFSYANILIKKSSVLYNDRTFLVNDIEKIPSIFISSSLKYYFLMKDFLNCDILKPNWDDFIFSGRIFSFKEIDLEKIKSISKKFFESKILLSDQAPFYSYLPMKLEDYQKKFLMGLAL